MLFPPKLCAPRRCSMLPRNTSRHREGIMPRLAATAGKVALAFSALVLCTTAAGAVSMRVQMACASDYMAYCNQHDPDGPMYASACAPTASSSRRAA